MPAKAGIQASMFLRCYLDSRLRGNDKGCHSSSSKGRGICHAFAKFCSGINSFRSYYDVSRLSTRKATIFHLQFLIEYQTDMALKFNLTFFDTYTHIKLYLFYISDGNALLSGLFCFLDLWGFMLHKWSFLNVNQESAPASEFFLLGYGRKACYGTIFRFSRS
jgi:hypothetical protein